MSKILFVSNNSKLTQTIEDIFKKHEQLQIEKFDSAKKAMAFLRKNDHYNLIITLDELQEDTGNLLFKYLVDKGLKIPFFIIGDVELDDDLYLKDLYEYNGLNANFTLPLDQDLFEKMMIKALDPIKQNELKKENKLEHSGVIYKAVPIK